MIETLHSGKPQAKFTLGTACTDRHVIAGMRSLVCTIGEGMLLRFLHGIVQYPQGTLWFNHMYWEETEYFHRTLAIAVVGTTIIETTTIFKRKPVIDDTSALATEICEMPCSSRF